jgi:uncharacterized protein (DUF885 family)
MFPSSRSEQRRQQIFVETELQTLFRQHHEFKRKAYPEWSSYDGDHRYDDRLTDLSDDASQKRCQKYRAFLRHLETLDFKRLSRDMQRNARLFAWVLSQDIQFHELGLHLLCIDQQEGMHLRFPQWAEVHPLETYAQYQHYFSRLKGFQKQIGDTLANLSLGLQRGLVHPRCVVEQSLLQMRELAQAKLATMPLYQPILRHSHHLSPELAQRVQQVAARLITEEVQPAYQQLYDFVAESYLPHCPQASHEVGLSHLPGGEAIYAYWIARHVKDGVTPAEIHAQGRAEIQRLHQTLMPILERLKLPAHWADLRTTLRDNPDYYFNDASTMMAEYTQMLARAEAELPSFFSRLPQTACVLKELEPWRAAAAPQAYYYTPPQDLSRPGVYYVNTHALHERPKYAMMALTLHEAVPGHHLQLARALEIPNLPDFRYHIEATAFVEGWALYAESLGFEMGLYDDLQTLGALSFELWRASRLVVDTGLHAMAWSREQAVQYLRDHTLQSETDIQSEVDRYIALPAQALAYKMGERQIVAWREQAQAIWQERFNLQDFHEVLLASGSLPLAELEEDVHRYLERGKQSAAAGSMTSPRP